MFEICPSRRSRQRETSLLLFLEKLLPTKSHSRSSPDMSDNWGEVFDKILAWIGVLYQMKNQSDLLPS